MGRTGSAYRALRILARIATRDDKRADTFLSAVFLVAALVWWLNCVSTLGRHFVSWHYATGANVTDFRQTQNPYKASSSTSACSSTVLTALSCFSGGWRLRTHVDCSRNQRQFPTADIALNLSSAIFGAPLLLTTGWPRDCGPTSCAPALPKNKSCPGRYGYPWRPVGAAGTSSWHRWRLRNSPAARKAGRD